MSALKFHSAVGKGTLPQEFIWIQVLEDIPNLAYYAVCDTTFTADGKISNELRHVYWFPPVASVKKGEWIRLFTKDGKNASSKNDKGTMIHDFFWKLGHTVWNKDGDGAVVFDLKSWHSARA